MLYINLETATLRIVHSRQRCSEKKTTLSYPKIQLPVFTTKPESLHNFCTNESVMTLITALQCNHILEYNKDKFHHDYRLVHRCPYSLIKHQLSGNVSIVIKAKRYVGHRPLSRVTPLHHRLILTPFLAANNLSILLPHGILS